MNVIDEQSEAIAGLRKALFGRRIVSAKDGVLKLDNDSQISFKEYGDCCAWANVERLSAFDNVITNVRATTGRNGEFSSDGWVTIFALSEASVEGEIAHIVGDEGSGYYSYGVRILLNGVEVGDVEQP